ncbi:MAG: heme biosynthesis HemY N-terminal domain-containing protein [Alphaproteobacteria bacterium]
MFRLFSFIILTAAIVAGVFFASTHLTDVLNLQLGNWDVSMPYSVAAIAAIAVIGLFVFLDRMVRWVFDLPFISPLKRSVRRQAKSYTAINKGLVAVAAGDSKEALKQAKRAEKLGDKSSLTHLLVAQAALSSNDEEEAIKRYTELLKDKDTRLMGYRGLFTLAVNRGDHQDALKIAKKAFELHPQSKWAFDSLFDLQIRTGNFDDALLLVPTGVKNQHFTPQEGQHLKAVLSTEIARIQKLSDGDEQEILKLLKVAHKEDVDFVPASLYLIHYYLDQGKKRKALQLMEAIWRDSPRHDIIPLWQEAQDTTDAEKLYGLAKKFALLNSDNEESRLLVASYAIKAQKWDDAESILNKLLSENDVPQQRTLRLLAELESRDENRQNPEKIQQYLADMKNARMTPCWVCDVSGIPAKEWQAISPSGKFDGLKWAEAGNVIQNQALMLGMDGGTSPSLLLSANSQELPLVEQGTSKETIDEEVDTEVLAEVDTPNEKDKAEKIIEAEPEASEVEAVTPKSDSPVEAVVLPKDKVEDKIEQESDKAKDEIAETVEEVQQKAEEEKKLGWGFFKKKEEVIDIKDEVVGTSETEAAAFAEAKAKAETEPNEAGTLDDKLEEELDRAKDKVVETVEEAEEKAEEKKSGWGFFK